MVGSYPWLPFFLLLFLLLVSLLFLFGLLTDVVVFVDCAVAPPPWRQQSLGDVVADVAPGFAQHEVAVDVAHFAVERLLVLLHFVNQALQ